MTYIPGPNDYTRPPTEGTASTLLVWGPPCRHGVPEAKRCDDCDDELAEQASGWTDHDSYRADHGGTWGDA